MKFLETKDAPKAIGPYSQAVEYNGLLYTSGQISLMPDGAMETGDIEHQTKQVMKNLFYVLRAGGSHYSDIIKVTIFLTDMNNFNKVNAIYEHLLGDHKPARSTVAVKELPKNALIEIECIAKAGGDYTF
ncbi:Bona fide RidA/YjgF/TdcF/RutC subgroup [hydrothermal vent metagenome]|uniref:Bona fide RidA/YjgF/TdcF/RutC subgroup n=1 Tax=hydrothermal vent metagenome TaxID=652676 RepID=A0A1W1EDA4_9ZZZZ